MQVWVAAAVGLVGGCTEYNYDDPDPPAPAPASPTGIPPRAEPPPPVANAGPDMELAPLDTATLDATRSSDPEGREIVAVDWTLIERPDGSTARLDDPTRPRPNLFLDLAGTYRLSLTVQNRAGVWDPTPDEIVVVAKPIDALYVQLAWDAETDLDLHLMENDSELFGPGDCNFCNMNPDWGGSGPRDDPSLDWDAVFGYGPEAITIENPAEGRYRVAVHFYGEGGLELCKGPCAPSEASVLVFVDGELAGKFSRTLTEQGDLWDVAEIAWPSGEITEVDTLGRTFQTVCRL